jgi:small-conductance mechanosensitive channel
MNLFQNLAHSSLWLAAQAAAATNSRAGASSVRVGPITMSQETYAIASKVVSRGLAVLLALAVAFIAMRLVPLLERLVIRWATRHEKDVARGSRPSVLDLQQRVETLTRVTGSVARAVIWTATLITVLGNVGLEIRPILAGAGIAGVAIGFGAQSIVKDFFSGFFILLESQYDVGDTVQIGTITGTVERMTMRITVVRDASGTAHFIPNSNVSNAANKTYGWNKAVLDVVFSEEVPDEIARATMDGAATRASTALGPSEALLDPVTAEGPMEFGTAGITWRLSGRVHAGRVTEAKQAMIAALATSLREQGLANKEGALRLRAALGEAHVVGDDNGRKNPRA